MLKVRVIPTLLWKDIGLVKGIGFDSWRRIDTILPAIKVYNLREVDELIIVDIAATCKNSDIDYEAIEEFSQECFVPLTVGGGVKSISDIKRLLRAGADKVCINSALYSNLELLEESTKIFGSQCIVVSIDAKKHSDNKYYCYSHAGKINTGLEVNEWAKTVEEHGAGEILITSIERDGTMQGYDKELIELVTKRVGIPVIASGGAGNYEDMYQVINGLGVSAVAAASIYHFTEQTPLEAKRYLAEKGIPVRYYDIS